MNPKKRPQRTGREGLARLVLGSDASVLEVAKDLAKMHREEDPETLEIWLAEAPDEVRLVEITKSVESSAAPEVLPFRFSARPDLGVFYPSVIVLLSPSEWKKVQSGELSLPPGWDKQRLRQVG